MALSMDPSCDAIDIQGTFVSTTSFTKWNYELSRQCMCFQITSSIPHNPQPRPIYVRNVTANSNFARYAVGSEVCIYVQRSAVTGFTAAMFTTPDAAAVTCPSASTRATNSLYFTLSRDNQTDACGNQGVDGMIDPDSVCLATPTADNKGWQCLLTTRAERLAAPTWSATSGRSQRRVQGTVNTDSQVLAFAYIPLPPEPSTPVAECNLWCQYKWVIIGCIIGIGVFIVCSAYAISRLKRYRDKYRENKKNLAQLKERADQIDEYAGGLGIADEDVDMMANPMVIEMKKLDQQLNEVNAQLDTQAERDTAKIEALAQDRERLHAELTRVKALMAQQQKQTATRLEDVHVSQPHYSASAAASSGRGPASPSALVPMEVEGAGGAAAGSERQQFGQVRRQHKLKE